MLVLILGVLGHRFAAIFVVFHVVLHVFHVVFHRAVRFHVHVARVSTTTTALMTVSMIHVFFTHLA